MKYAALSVLLLAAVLLVSQTTPRTQVGPVGDNAFLLNSGWKLEPAGEQVPVETLPMSAVFSKDKQHLIVLNGGYNAPTISVLDVKSRKEVSRTPVADGWLGLALSPDGKKLYVGGGVRASVFEFDFADGKLTPARTITVVPEDKRAAQDFVGDVTVAPDGRFLYATILYRDEVALINLSTGVVVERVKTARRPYRLLFSPKGDALYVSSWADAAVVRHDPQTGERKGLVRVGNHTTDMLWSDRVPSAESEREEEEEDEKEKEAERKQWPYARRMFVTAANSNDVHVFGVSESGDMTRLETINVALTPRMPLGMTPSALGLSPDQKTLYVVCSDANAVAVVDVSGRTSRPLGFIPVGWYPTAALTAEDGTLIVLNGKGLRSYPNVQGPNPLVRIVPRRGDPVTVEYVGRLQKGTIGFIAPPKPEELRAYTERVLRNSPYNDNKLDQAHTAEGSVIPQRPGEKGPIEHVIYVVKENRTYDQIFGDVKEGNGDPSLQLFDDKVAPNHRKLAREYVLFDNFYVNADVSADGHNWSTSAIANDYVQKMWPNSYGGRRKTYDYEGGEPAALPPAGYIWTNAQMAGITMRNYGWWAENAPAAEVKNGVQIKSVRDATLRPVTNLNFRGFDLDYLDVDRIKVFLQDLAQFDKQGQMPRLMFVRIGNDHTSGLAADKYSPKAAMADNDYALGMLIEALSKSKFWSKTAVFVLEDDAQNGADHVDSHRSPAFIISPYTRRGVTDSTMYNTVSVLRTMELILGLRPMTHYDAGATPMFTAFSSKADTTPYVAVKPAQSLEERNPAANSAAAAASARMDFSEADRIDDDELNKVLWRALKGSEPPAPRRSRFGR